MASIGGKPDIPAGYFHQIDDTTKTATAQRATFNPSVNNQITNRFTRMGMPKVANMVNSVRNMDLSIRQSVNKRRLDSARSKFGALEDEQSGDTEKLQKYGGQMQRFGLKQARLDNKRLIGEAAVKGELADGTQLANQAFAGELRSRDYQELSGLRDTPLHQIASNYLSSRDDRHRIKINSERPPALARMIANSVSSGYDNGSSGASRAARSTVQHALVGIQGAALSIKGSMSRSLSESKWLDEGARARMDVRAARTTQKKSMLQASFQGNIALNRAFERTRGEQAADAAARLANPEGPDYEIRESIQGVKPPQTRLWERRASAFASAFYAAPPEAANHAAETNSLAGNDVASAEAQGRKAGRMARVAIGISNIGPRAALAYHAAKASQIHVKLHSARSEEEYDSYDLKREKQEALINNRAHVAMTRRSIVQGKLIDTLKSRENIETMDASFPLTDDVQRPLRQQGRERATPTPDSMSDAGSDGNPFDDIYEASDDGLDSPRFDDRR